MGEIEYGPYPQHAARFQDWLLECDELGIRNCFIIGNYLELKDSLRKFYRFASNEEFEDYLFARVEERKNKRIADAKSKILEARREITTKRERFKYPVK